MDKHKVCKNAIFDETWGEYKCKATQKRISDVNTTCRRCKDFARDKEKK